MVDLEPISVNTRAPQSGEVLAFVVEPAARYASLLDAMTDVSRDGSIPIRRLVEAELLPQDDGKPLQLIVFQDGADLDGVRAVVIEASRIAAIAIANGFRPVINFVDGLPSSEFLKRLPTEDHSAASSSWETATLAPVLAIYRNDGLVSGQEFHWGMGTFVYGHGHQPDQSPGLLDISGRPRYLSYGPYTWLPSGLWKIKLELWIDAAAAERQVRVEWGGVEAFAQSTFRAGRPGRYLIQLENRWATAGATELRVVLTESALEGTIELKRASLSWFE